MDYSKLKKLILNLIITVIGLFVFSAGVHFTIYANFGLAPWDCLSSAVSQKLSVSFGTIHVTVSIIIVIIDILLKEKIGFGTLLDAVLVGVYIDFLDIVSPLEVVEGNIIKSVIYIIIGIFIMAFGQAIYMKAALGCGPRDALTVGVGKRFPKTPIGLVQGTILALVLLVGFLLGGPVGIGTVITTFGIGVAVQIVFNILRFEPRSIKHKNLYESLIELKKETP